MQLLSDYKSFITEEFLIRFRGKKGSLNYDLQCGDLIFVFDEQYQIMDRLGKDPLVDAKGNYVYGSNLKGLLF